MHAKLNTNYKEEDGLQKKEGGRGLRWNSYLAQKA
jgi:hypothetical protein